MNKQNIRLAALQIGACPSGSQSTLARILDFEAEIAEAKPDVLVLPEALLGGYPKGSDFGTQMGFRRPEGREEFLHYFNAAVDLDGPEVAELCALANRTEASVIVGVIERSGSSLYCTALFIDPILGLIDKHRKLMPTGTERLVWAQGDGSTLSVVQTAAGPAAAAICWENYMPLLRMALYAKGVEIWCAPTVDAREAWQSTMRHVALEGRCFVISACQYQPSPATSGQDVENWPQDDELIAGGSVIIGPMGDVLAGPLRQGEGLIVADCDRNDIPRSRFDFDVVGHYARPDVFELKVDETSRQSVKFSGSEGQTANPQNAEDKG